MGARGHTGGCSGGIAPTCEWAAPLCTRPGQALLQAAALLGLSSPVAFCLTVLRFRPPAWRFPALFATLVFALSVCGAYRTPAGQLWKLPLYL